MRRVLNLVVSANSQRNRTATLLALREDLEELKVLLRLGQDLKVFSGVGWARRPTRIHPAASPWRRMHGSRPDAMRVDARSVSE